MALPGLSLGLTVAQWALIEQPVPVLSIRGRNTRGEGPPRCPRRRMVDAILQVTAPAVRSRQLPHDCATLPAAPKARSGRLGRGGTFPVGAVRDGRGGLPRL
jgi:hypothetical protein